MRNMKQLIIPEKVQKEMLADFMSMGETKGLIGGYCEDEFPIYYANEEMALMLGYDTVEELVEAIDGKVIHTIHPDDREQVIKDIGGKYYEGLTYETTYRMPRKDGSWFWTVDKGKVIRTDEGKLAIISACYDMTSFVERHKKLEEQNILSQATINQISGGYHRCSLEEGHPFLYISDRFLSILGWTREEIKTIFDNDNKEAVDIVSQSVPGRFDFIFMDIMMPVMDGLEAARQIRKLNRVDTKEIPIIAMTANAFQDDIRECIVAGMNAHIAKPIDSKKIEDTLQMVLNQKIQ